MNIEKLNQNYLSSLERYHKKLKGKEVNNLSIMKQGYDLFKEMGIPHKKMEDWKYTNISNLLNDDLSFGSEGVPQIGQEEKREIEKSILHNKFSIVLVNGYLATEFTKIPFGAELTDNIGSKTGSSVSSEIDAFEALNMATSEHILQLNITEKITDSILTIVHFVSPERHSHMLCSRIIINMGPESAVTVLETFYGSNKNYQNNSFTKINLAREASVEHIKVVTGSSPEVVNIGKVCAQLESHAVFSSFTFTLGGGVTRNNVVVDLNAAGASTSVHGLYAVESRQHVDNFVQIHHKKPKTKSEQLFKGILDDYSRGIFTGKVVIHQDAQESVSTQLSRNLLLGEHAHADTRPQLEVNADNVECTHGATVGQISAEELFYLASRGISQESARHLLCRGFALEALDKIQNKMVKTHLNGLLEKNFLTHLPYLEQEKR